MFVFLTKDQKGILENHPALHGIVPAFDEDSQIASTNLVRMEIDPDSVDYVLEELEDLLVREGFDSRYELNHIGRSLQSLIDVITHSRIRDCARE